jgi:hypothetical protein
VLLYIVLSFQIRIFPENRGRELNVDSGEEVYHVLGFSVYYYADLDGIFPWRSQKAPEEIILSHMCPLTRGQQ